jgi:hypothetical protein
MHGAHTMRVGALIVALALPLLVGVTVRASQPSLPDGAFVLGQDGTGWIVAGGAKYRIAWTFDEQDALALLPEGGEVRSVSDAVALLGLSPTPAVAPISGTPAPSPPPTATDDRGLVGQTAVGLCSSLSRTRFTATIEQAQFATQVMGISSSGYWVIVVASVTNTGAQPDDTFRIAVLVDERGRRFESLSSSDFPPYFDVRRQLGVRSHVDDIQPGITAQVLWVFEVPRDVRRLQLASAVARCRV